MSSGSSLTRFSTRLPFFYGWLLVAIAFITMAVGVNARTAFSLMFPAVLDEFGWDRGMTAGAFSFGFLVSAAVTPFVGRLVDRRGPAIVIEVGVLTMAAGLIRILSRSKRKCISAWWACANESSILAAGWMYGVRPAWEPDSRSRFHCGQSNDGSKQGGDPHR